jgi:two-component system, cell cycle sensor histidine kinase and response regulator CckA
MDHDRATNESSELFRVVAETASDVIISIDHDSVILFANPAAERIFGYPIPEILGQQVTLLMPECLRLLHKTAIRSYVATGRKHIPWTGLQLTGLHKSGAEIPLEISFGEHVRNGKHVFTGILRDVSERSRIERDLRHSQEKYAKMIHSSPDAITLRSLPDRRYIEVSEGFTRLTGYSAEEVIGKTPTEIGIWSDDSPHAEILENLQREGAVREVEFTFRTKSGEHRYATVSAVRLTLGAESYMLSTSRDITERRSLERQLLQSQKMEAIGRLAGGVAHDFNNLLGVILGQTELLQAEFEKNPSVHRRAEAIEHAGRRAAELTKQLLAFSRQQFIEPRVIDTNAIVRDMEKLLQRLIGEDVELTIHLQADAGNIKVDPSQLEQILMNLALNARDAMPNGGKLVLETACVELDDTYARQHLGAKAGDFLMLVVSDTGTGMDSQTMGRIFEPFFTTKPDGRGTGLGLSTVYGIVKQNNGYIMPYSEVGHGTTFRIYFPRVRETPELRDYKWPQGATAKGSETILIVEDEEALRELARELLEANGYKVIEAERGENAIRLVEGSQTPIDLLLTDVVMPGMGGRQLAKRLLELRPGLHVLYMSGYTDDVINNRGVLKENTLLLPKPFTRAVLLRKVREALNARISLSSL